MAEDSGTTVINCCEVFVSTQRYSAQTEHGTGLVRYAPSRAAFPPLRQMQAVVEDHL